MKNRKVSIEKNSEYKESSAHPSLSNLGITSTSHQKRSRSTKSPSVQNLDKSCSLNNFAKTEKDRKRMLPDEMQPPKTRFKSQDRSKEKHSISSPRLKSFPAEKIKKLDNQSMFSPELNGSLIVQDPRETGTFFANSIRSNNDQGDAIPATLSSYQQSKPQDKSDADQQEILANRQQIYQTNPQSKNIYARPIASPEGHTFVSNMPEGTVVCDRSFQNPSGIINQPVIIQAPSTHVPMSQTQQFSNNPHAIIDQNRNETSAFIRCKEQPISDQSAVNKQIFTQPKQTAIVQNANAPLSAGQNVCHAQFHDPFQQNSQQINEQTQHNAYYQQILPQAHNQMQPPMLDQRQHLHNNSETFYGRYNRQSSAAHVPEHGMTSPQDMTVNQMRMIQHNLPIYNQNNGYPVSLRPAQTQNERWIQNQHLHQQSPQQWPYYQDTHFDQKESKNQGQSNPSQNKKSSNRQSTAEAHNQQNDEKKKLQFTPDMIRDQELLVSTMRQQGIPEDIMRRQFDALLKEQQKHLIYLAQFQQQEDIHEKHNEIKIQNTQKRIEKDEKPEWMIHITPPRISYNEIERMKAQQRDQKEQFLMNNQSPEEINRTVATEPQDYYQQKKQEINNQANLPQQMYVQMNPHQMNPHQMNPHQMNPHQINPHQMNPHQMNPHQMNPHQLRQQQMIWPYKNDQTMHNYTACYPYHQQSTMNNIYHQVNPTFNKHIPYNIRYNPYYSHPEQQKIWQNKEHNLNSSNSTNNHRLPTNLAYFEQNKRLTEPSSLLKMRMYKEMICPQKRNNGLQDPDTIQKVMETLKNPSSRKGLEYLANITKNNPVVKLNGTQDHNEIPEDMRPRLPVEISRQQPQKEISANGLENTRNPNNPVPCILRPKRADETAVMEYPRQRQNPRICYSMQAEKENGAINGNQQRWQPRNHAMSYAQDARSIPYNPQNVQGNHNDNVRSVQYAGAPPQHYHPIQQYYLNERNLIGHNGGQGDVAKMQRPDAPGAMRIDRAGGDTCERSNVEGTTKRVDIQPIQGTNVYGRPDVQETRTIGGITYLARKPEYAPNNLVISPDKLIASRHLQPPRIF